MQIAPSLLAADFLRLEKDVEMLNAASDLIHLDIMDGSFVPNISFGFSVVEASMHAHSNTSPSHLLSL